MAQEANGAALGAAKERRDFSKIHSAIAIPNLLDMQQESYERFLQMDRLPDERVEDGLEAVFKSVFPISDFREMSSLEFVSYSIGDWACKCGAQSGLSHLRTRCRHCRQIIRTDPKGPPEILCEECGKRTPNEVTFCDKCGDPVGLKLKYDPEECKRRSMTYAAPLKVNIRLTVFEKDGAGDQKSVRDIKEQEVFFGEIPLMTEEGTFIVTGTERVIVSQLHRSPGVFFESSADNTYYLGKIIPSRGSWIEFEYDAKKPTGQRLLNVRIDRKRKFLGTIFLRALGLESDADILGQFYRADTIRMDESGALQRDISESLMQTRLAAAVTGKSGKALGRKGRKINARLLQDMRADGITALPCPPEDLDEAIFADDIFDEESGEVLHGCEANTPVTSEAMARVRQAGIKDFKVIFPETDECGPVLSETLRKDSVKTRDQALLAIYRNLRPGDPPTRETATKLFNDMFFDARKYDFSRVGRMKFNIKLHGEEEATPLDRRVLDASDFYATIGYLFKLRRKIGATDDIDHLGNRRVRSVGELLENQFRIGLIRMERAMRDRMTSYQDMSSAMPHDLINAKPVMAAVREFFGSSQLSQFMDQINPLSEITHKRRLSSLGPGGLSRERAGFDVRDVHATHYGRICPIETAEGANIGLISSLSCFARINQYGFIESPYRKVENGRVVDEVKITYAGDTQFEPGQVVRREQAEQTNDALGAGQEGAHWETHCDYLSAWEEDRHIIAQANIPVEEDGYIGREFANCRVAGDTRLKKREEIQYLDVSPKQLVSVAASLIPFLENDDANRALMGSNMQRQAVPLLRADSPIVGTGMERITARDSGAVVLCKRSGVVDSVDAERIIVRVEDTGHEEQLSREVGADIYPLIKFRRSNQNTCINQKPIVKIGDRVAKGQVLADGPCTDDGELALGRNVLVAFMPWRGYNFEDAILVSEKLVKEDYYTSLHIEELKIEARDTKLGPEEITRDIPNISEGFLKNLDESGIIRIGAKVGPDDILVGKVVPRGDVQLTPEEKLLRAIFGDKADDVKDASLRCPAGVSGVVVGAKVFSRRGVEKDSRAKAIEEAEIERLQRNLEDEKRILYDQRVERLEELLGGNTVTADLHDERTNRRLASADEVLGRDHFERMRARDLKRLRLAQPVDDLDFRVDALEQMTIRQIEVLEKLNDKKVEKLRQGDELSPGVLKTVTISIAMKRKLSAGDKMAGRHGNKGVIARVMPEEDMPFLPDGTPVEIVLNPLGVPSRMNVGQILETHLGWAGEALGLKFAAPVFEGPSEGLIKEHLRNAGLPESGKTRLCDGLTGRAFEQEVTVGIIYMLKLNHLVDDKIHARSIGPYSLVTQQPLGGKAQFGGQRFGEMEVWALEAYGSAHILRELLTVKSDDVFGRAKIYESIVKGESAMNPGLPESFNVLVRELQALCLDVELLNKHQSSEDRGSTNLFDPSVAPAPLPAGDLNPAMGGYGAQNPFASAAAQRVTAMPDFDAVRIGLASPEKIRGWSFGEVTKPETINYRTFKPERNGLFCTAIFGPEKDWECLCGKYKRMKHRGVICEKCGTEVTHSRVRRERLGHIELAAPCSHVWYFKVLPSHLSLLLDIKVSDLERVLYYEASAVVASENPFLLPTTVVLSGEELASTRPFKFKLRRVETEGALRFTKLAGRGRFEVLAHSGDDIVLTVLESENLRLLPKGTIFSGDELSTHLDVKKFDVSLSFTPLGADRYRVRPDRSIFDPFEVKAVSVFEVTVLMGAEAIRDLLRSTDIEALAERLRVGLETEPLKLRNNSLLLDLTAEDIKRVWNKEASLVEKTENPDLLPSKTVLSSDSLVKSRINPADSLSFTKLEEGDGFGRYEVCARARPNAAFAVTAFSGPDAIYGLLREIDIGPLVDQLREEMKAEVSDAKRGELQQRLAVAESLRLFRKLGTEEEWMHVENSAQKRRKMAQRLRVGQSFGKSGNKPEWMILQVLPIIPPELRPLVPLDGGRFATSDLNDLYRRVINRNNRLKRLLEQRAPDVIVRNEKRMLQEAVDALLDNGRRGHELRGANKRPLKSLANTLKGKSGRFRQNLLGKRVDYSGRSVIVVGPELKLHQCGLPKKMALELYKPFIYQRLEQRGHCTTIKQAKELVEQKDAIVWDILDGVIQDHPVLLNRAPTLHRLGIQAFEPVLVEGKAIKIHPLVCTAFNADFDGDQMGVHVPLSPEAQIEAHVLMLSANNILSPASGLPITTPSQDMVLGVYYLTGAQEGARGAGRSFGSIRDVLLAYDMDEVETRAPIKLHYSGAVIDLTLAGDSQDVRQTVPVFYQKQTLETTVGRVLLKDRLPKELPFVNGLLKKRGLSDLVRFCYQQLGREKTVEMLDELKELGFLYATLSGMSIGIDDMIVPEQKEQLVSSSQKEVMTVEQQYLDGAITHGERYNKIIEIWSSLTDSVSREMFEGMRSSEPGQSSLNPIYAMADSGARGSETQIRQLSGMRGLMAKPSGEIIETPITANFREGLNVLQYFISTHGARKGLADTALKTANSGYLTRRLVDVAQDVIITEFDCGTTEGITKGPLVENGEIRVPLSERIVGRVMAEDASDLEGRPIISAGEEVTDEVARAIESANINQEVDVRSVLTCETERGVCQLCYGQDLATGRMVEEGQAVGIIAAQSIGEPGTQLTMRTFHVGGTATRVGQDSRQTAKSDGFAKYVNVNPIRDKSGQLVAMSRNGFIAVVDSKGRERERYQVVYAARLRVEDGEEVVREQVLLEWDPFTRSILTESEGFCRFCDLQEGVTLQEQVDEVSGLSQWVVTDPEDGQRAGEPRIEIHDGDGKLLRRYLIPTTAHLMVKDDEAVSAGDELAKIPLATTKNKDITGGLPRVVELFEARRPKSPEPAIISEIDGTVSYGSLSRGYRRITVTGAGGEEKEYKIPRGSHINVQEGELVKAGEPLMEGPHDPQDILRILGEADLQSYLVNEIQDVYRLQGVDINDKHLEVIVRQMMRWVKIDSVGDTEFLVDEVVDKFRFRRVNRDVEASGGVPATSQALLMGIRKAAVSTDSFISAASFETTTKVLTEASVAGRVDDLRGLKENVIVGRLIPAGTGLKAHQRVRIAGEDEPDKLVPEMEYLNDIPGYSEDATQLFENELPMGFGEDFALEGVKLPPTGAPEASEADLSAPADPVVPD